MAGLSYTVTALVSLGCQSKCHQLQGLNKKHLCFTILKSGSQRSGYQRGQVLERAPFLACLHGREREREEQVLSCLIIRALIPLWGLSRGSVAKSLPANAGDVSQSLGREDSLEKEMATQSSILAWKIPWTEEPEWATVPGVAKSQTGLSNWACISHYEAPPFWPKTSQKPCLHTSSHWGLGIWYRNLVRRYNIQSIRTIPWVNYNYGLRALFKKKYKYSNYYIRP